MKNVISKEFCERIVERTHALDSTRDQSFHKIFDGCPNFHRLIDHEVSRRYSLTAIKHATYYFPWNSDPLDLFGSFNEIWRVFKYFGGFPARAFENNIPSDGVIDRIQIAQYPAGVGELNRHIDPVKNQRVIIGLIMSKRGEEYQSGGFYYVDTNDRVIDVEDQLDIGDILCCYPTVHHGVEIIDPDKQANWSSVEGRWWLGPASVDSDHLRERMTASRVEETR